MTCANVMLTVFAAAIAIVAIWPNLFGAASMWITLVAAILVLIVAWTSVDCKYCKNMPAAKKKR